MADCLGKHYYEQVVQDLKYSRAQLCERKTVPQGQFHALPVHEHSVSCGRRHCSLSHVQWSPRVEWAALGQQWSPTDSPAFLPMLCPTGRQALIQAEYPGYVLASSLAGLDGKLLALLGDCCLEECEDFEVMRCLRRLVSEHAQDRQSTGKCTVNLRVDVTVGEHGEA